MIQVSWINALLAVAVLALGAMCAWLWKRRNGHAITEAAADIITELSAEVGQLKRKVQQLEIKTVDSQNRITMLQGELALATAETHALDQLIAEQAGRIGDLRSENEQLRRSMIRVMKKTGTLSEE